MLKSSTNPLTKDRDMLKDALERLYKWIDVLEKRAHALLNENRQLSAIS